MVIKKQITSIPRVTLRRCSRQIDSERPDDILLSLRRVSESLGVRRVKQLYVDSTRGRVPKWKIGLLLSMGLMSIIWGMATLIYTPLQMFLAIRLEMTPGLPPYDWWLNPPDEVLLKAYIFNITNSERFMNGTDKKIMVQEIGPIIYREKMTHTNVKHNGNGTLTYTSSKEVIMIPEMNTININDTIYAPNLAVLLIPAHFHDSSMFVKLGVNMLLRSYNAQPIVKTTIYNFLWNMSDPILTPAKKIAPSLVPTTNTGILNIVYANFKNNVTLFIGSEHGNSKFFTINNYDGSEYLPHFSDPKKCQKIFRNSSEGLGYPQMITRDANLTYFRKTLCKLGDLRYARDQSKYGMSSYRFHFMSWAYDRQEWEGNKDCHSGSPPLPNGLSDISACYWGFPMVVSFPHYLHGDDSIKTRIDGMTPNEEDHGSYVLIEPITGVPLEGKARSQVNLAFKKLQGFPKNIQRFSEALLPLAWLEYYQVGIPWYMQWLVYYTAVIIPICQLPFSILCISVGAVSTYFGYLSLSRRKHGSQENLIKDTKLIGVESEAFLKDDSF